jgi:hypothetical protein
MKTIRTKYESSIENGTSPKGKRLTLWLQLGYDAPYDGVEQSFDVPIVTQNELNGQTYVKRTVVLQPPLRLPQGGPTGLSEQFWELSIV